MAILSPSRLDAAHHLGDARHRRLDAPFRGHLVGHEREPVAIAILERRNHADAFDAANDGVALFDVAQLPARRARAFDDDHGVHPLIADVRAICRSWRTCVSWLVVE